MRTETSQPANTLYQPGILDGVPAVARFVLFNLASEGATPDAIKQALTRLAPSCTTKFT